MSPEALAAIRAQLDEQRALFVVGNVYACDNCMGVSDADRDAGGREPWPAHGPECSWGAVAALLDHVEALEQRIVTVLDSGLTKRQQEEIEAYVRTATAVLLAELGTAQVEARRLREALKETLPYVVYIPSRSEEAPRTCWCHLWDTQISQWEKPCVGCRVRATLASAS